MTEADLLDRTLNLVHQARLPTTLGLGETWVIVLAASPSLPPFATERFEATLADYRNLYPDDVFDFSHGNQKRTTATRYLLLRTGSLAVTHWLTQAR